MLVEIEGFIIDTIWILSICPIKNEEFFEIVFAIDSAPPISVQSNSLEEITRRRNKLIDAWSLNIENYFEGKHHVIKI